MHKGSPAHVAAHACCAPLPPAPLRAFLRSFHVIWKPPASPEGTGQWAGRKYIADHGAWQVRWGRQSWREMSQAVANEIKPTEETGCTGKRYRGHAGLHRACGRAGCRGARPGYMGMRGRGHRIARYKGLAAMRLAARGRCSEAGHGHGTDDEVPSKLPEGSGASSYAPFTSHLTCAVPRPCGTGNSSCTGHASRCCASRRCACGTTTLPVNSGCGWPSTACSQAMSCTRRRSCCLALPTPAREAARAHAASGGAGAWSKAREGHAEKEGAAKPQQT